LSQLLFISLFSALTKCMELNNVPKDDFVVPIVLNVTTEASIFDGPLLTENYANYVDHQESYYKNLEDVSVRSLRMGSF
jgi:hypothetical protein